MSLCINLITILIGLLTAGYLFIKYRYSYFKRLKVPYAEPKFPNGSLKGKFLTNIQEFYNKFKDDSSPVFGIFLFLTPMFVVKDLEFVKQILVKEFNSFPERGLYTNPKDDPLSNHLFNMEAREWKEQRSKLSPTFSSGKMKFMFPTVVDIAYRFKDVLNEIIDNSKSKFCEIEMKDLLARYTTDIIVNVAFGAQCNTLKDPNSIFREKGRIAVSVAQENIVLKLFKGQFQNLARMLKIKMTSDGQIKFFRSLVQQTIQSREAAANTRRNDFMDLLLEIGKNNVENRFTLEQIMAHTYVFFLAGFETSSTTMAFALYELVRHPKVQTKVRQEINDVLKKYDGKISYEALIDMVYLEQIINETLRKYPPVTFLARKCIEDYKIPNTNIVIEKGISVMIPSFAIHNDPQYYSNPEVFDPDRFAPDKMKERNPMTFLSFGDGPRNCIGLRFGRMQAKIGLALLLQNFEFFVGDKLEIPVKLNPNSAFLMSDEGLWLNIKKIKKL